jgi:ParB/RepB/Spo0J family partition protein
MHSFEIVKLPLDIIERDPEQPREDLHIYDRFGAELQASIQKQGILIPLVVRALESGRYMVIDGHRRLICAQRRGLLFAPCQVYNNLTIAEVWRLRFELQDNWLPEPGFRSKIAERRRELALILSGHTNSSHEDNLPSDELVAQ